VLLSLVRRRYAAQLGSLAIPRPVHSNPGQRVGVSVPSPRRATTRVFRARDGPH